MSEGGFLFTPYAKINSKWITDIIVSVKSIKPIENVGINLHEFGLGINFLDTALKVQVAKDITDKQYFI